MFAKLEVGLQKPLLVRREELGTGLGVRLLYASDIHLRPANERSITEELLAAVRLHHPQVVLLGGDLVDHPRSLPTLRDLVCLLSRECPVGAVSGNHDTLLGYERVRQTVLEGKGQWLMDSPVWLEGLQFLGRTEQRRAGAYSVLCGHYPTVFPGAREAGVELALAGHLHGWQIVLWQRGEYLYPGAWLSRWNGLRFQRGESTLLVSRGMTDLLALRWNCPREVLLVEL